MTLNCIMAKYYDPVSTICKVNIFCTENNDIHYHIFVYKRKTFPKAVILLIILFKAFRNIFTHNAYVPFKF